VIKPSLIGGFCCAKEGALSIAADNPQRANFSHVRLL
jgi:hypothetical protein